jgi:alpha-ketoglutarate-dependent taurine dioxygenase
MIVTELSSLQMEQLAIQIPKLRIPKVCYQILSTNQESDISLYQYILTKYGMLLIQVKGEDDSGTALQNIVAKIGKAHTHDANGTVIWDIIHGGSSGNEELARSHGVDEFQFHTDCAYEEMVPEYFGLYVIRPDIKGGGINLLLSTESIVQKLSDRAFSILVEQPYMFRIPLEFYKGNDFIKAYIIDENLKFRYRRDIIEEHFCNQEQLQALGELDDIILNRNNGYQLFLKKHQILLLDNRRYLHARTRIKDEKRHLKRIRFNMLKTTPETMPVNQLRKANY